VSVSRPWEKLGGEIDEIHLLLLGLEKNIRRRVYDALNVLMAMDIIAKERKEIRWKGLPTSLQHDAEMLIVRTGHTPSAPNSHTDLWGIFPGGKK
jgi:hypothetical protein